MILLIPSAGIIMSDPFRVFGNYENYFDNNFISVNRDYICTETYLKNRKNVLFNSFIFGNSRSRVFNCIEWQKHLPENSRAFHFDASSESLYGINKKILLIEKLGDSLKNAMIILDGETLIQTKNKPGHIFISHPLQSGDSYFAYYAEFIKPAFDIKFVVGFYDYKIFHTHRPYMDFFFLKTNFENSGDPVNCDFEFGYEKMIKTDSIGYYNNLIQKGVFYDRKQNRDFNFNVTESEINLLNEIAVVLKKHKTNYKIIIPPNYDQIPLNVEQITLLEKIFGKEFIYNFSGKNNFTENLSNFYEDQHFRPPVADSIMKIIYSLPEQH